jgi:hypothetical protein
VFGGWSSPCGRLGDCGITVNGDIAVAATFLLANQTVGGGESGEVAGVQSESVQLYINEVMAGSSASVNDEFVELYNPNSSPVVLTGWTIKKKTSSGSESTLVSAARLENVSIPAGGYLLIGHEGSYAGSVVPDVMWPGSYSIAYTNNSLVLFGPDASVVNEVAWTEISPDQSYARQTPGGATFVAGSPTPQNAAGQ